MPANHNNLQELLTEQLSESYRNAQGSIPLPEPITDKLPAIPNAYLPFNVMDLYQRLVVSNLDMKGNMASCYSSMGNAIAMTATFDFGDLILPGFLTLSAGATLTGTSMNTALLILHRNMPRFPLAIDDQSVARAYATAYPLSFLTMAGKKRKVSFTIEAKGGVKKEFQNLGAFPKLDYKEAPKSPETASLQLELSTQVSGSITGVMMHIQDPTPGLYPHWRDPNLLKDFHDALGKPNLDKLKIKVVEWYEYILTRSVENLNKINPHDPSTLFVKKSLISIKAQKDFSKKATELLNGQLQKEINKAANGASWGDKLGGLLNALVNKKPTVAELSTDLIQLLAIFTVWEDNPEAKDIIEKINWDLDQLKLKRDPIKKPEDFFDKIGNQLKKDGSTMSDTLKKMSMLTYFSVIPSFTGGANINIGANFSIQGKGLNANVKAGSNMDGQIGYSSYRYQTFGNLDEKTPIIFTQDTAINYRQVRITNTAGITAFGKFDKQKTGTYLYNQITYRAAQLFWPLSEHAHDKNHALALAGSGVSYGISIRPEKLASLTQKIKVIVDDPKITGWDKEHHPDTNNEYHVFKNLYKKVTAEILTPTVANDPKNLSKPEIQLLKSLAAALQMPHSDLVEFLDGSNLDEIKNTNLDKVEAIILESNYRLTNPLSLFKVVASDKKGKQVEDLIKAMEQPITANLLDDATPNKLAELTAIRVRFRMADHMEAQNTLFKLGFSVGAKLAIDFKKVSEAGIESIVDVYTYWFPPFRHLFKKPDPVLESQMVPPVSLFFQ